MTASLLTFAKGGVHPPESKEITEHLAIEKMPLPAQVEIPLLQHFGAPCQPLVNKKDRVEEGDLIGQVQGLGANVHASITGTVTNVGTSIGPTSLNIPSVTIDRDSEDQRWRHRRDWRCRFPGSCQAVSTAGCQG